MRIVTPLRFVSGVIACWIVGRTLILVPELATGMAEADVAGHAGRREPASPAAPAVPAGAWSVEPAGVAVPAGAAIATAGGDGVAQVDRTRAAAPVPALASASSGRPSPRRAVARRPATPAAPAAPVALAALVAQSPWPAGVDAAPSPSGIVVAPSATPSPPGIFAAASRWSGNLYVYRRGAGSEALASGGQLGGSQAGARIAYRLNATGPARFAAAARLSAPLASARGAEAAAGLDWQPLPGRPLRVSVERRVDLGGAARNAWSAYAAGGFWREPRPGLVVDGYAQAGIVGARRRDLFADGALRGGGRRDLGQGRSLTVGAGAWGAAQPRVARLDIGPRVALGLPVGGAATTLAAEWRIRVAGDATPRSGLAVTLATDF